MTPDMDKLIALASTTLAAFLICGATLLAKITESIVGAEVNDGLINVIVAVSLTGAVAGVGFIIKFLLDMKTWQGRNEERITRIEEEMKDDRTDGRHH